jgi:hypothetical protein
MASKDKTIDDLERRAAIVSNGSLFISMTKHFSTDVDVIPVPGPLPLTLPVDQSGQF